MARVRSRIYEGKPASGSGSGGGGGTAFNGNRPITRNTPGIIGVNLGTNSISDTLEALLYPATAPETTLSVNDPVREVGADTAYTLTWAVVKKTNPITGITVDGTAVPPTGNNQNGTASGNTPVATGTHHKQLFATDGGLSSHADVDITYLPRMFWGTTVKDGNTAPILDADILGLANSGLKTDYKITLVNFGGGNTRLIFAIPTAFGNPQFYLGGFLVTAFTKVRSNSDFVNAEGATVKMDVWVSDNNYNSAIGSVILN